MTSFSSKISVGILGATGMVGQRFVSLLANHPWFTIVVLAASSTSAGKTYAEAVDGRWALSSAIPESVKNIKLLSVESDVSLIAQQAKLVFSAINMDKEPLQKLELDYAAAGLGVVSNNSAHRWTEDVPLVLPEVNADHLALITTQRKRRGWTKGFLAVKPNCSIQSYVPPLHALREFGLQKVCVSTYQAISGAGKTFSLWPEMVDNVIPFIGGEEEKSEQEPMKVWGSITDGVLQIATVPKISAACIRVPVSDGHLATVRVTFDRPPSREEIIARWAAWKPLAELDLPSAPAIPVTYYAEDNRPQTKLDRDLYNGMGVSVGRLNKDSLFDYKFVGLSHNTVRGAAGGAVLLAELLFRKGFIL